MTHLPAPCDLFHDPLDGVSEPFFVVTAVQAEALDLLDLNPDHLARVRLSLTEIGRVTRLSDRLAGIPLPRSPA